MAQTWVPHLKLSFGGRLGGTPAEIWSNTLRFYCINFVPTRGQLATANDAVEAALVAWFGSNGANIAESAEISYSKLNWVLADGHQRDSDTVVNDFTAPARGSQNSAYPPFFQTQAITLRTRVKRGRGHSGRIYPPCVTFIPDGLYSPYTTQAKAAGAAEAFVVMVRAVRTAIGTSWGAQGGPIPDLSVFSPGNTDGSLQPKFTPVIAAVCDRVPDVQHRRTKQIPRSEGTTYLLDP